MKDNEKRVMVYMPREMYEELAALHTAQGGRMNTIIIKAIKTGLKQTAQEAAQKGENHETNH